MPILKILKAIFLSLILMSALGFAPLIGTGLYDTAAPSDVGIVLGSKVERDGQPSARLKARLDKAATLYRQKMFGHIIVSGGFGKEGYDEAQVMQRYLVQQGVAESAVLLDSQGNTTRATAQNSARLMREHGWKSAVVVTQYFHIARSILALRQAGIGPVTSAHPAYFELRDLYAIPREAVGYLAYLLR